MDATRGQQMYVQNRPKVSDGAASNEMEKIVREEEKAKLQYFGG